MGIFWLWNKTFLKRIFPWQNLFRLIKRIIFGRKRVICFVCFANLSNFDLAPLPIEYEISKTNILVSSERQIKVILSQTYVSDQSKISPTWLPMHYFNILCSSYAGSGLSLFEDIKDESFLSPTHDSNHSNVTCIISNILTTKIWDYDIGSRHESKNERLFCLDLVSVQRDLDFKHPGGGYKLTCSTSSL